MASKRLRSRILAALMIGSMGFCTTTQAAEVESESPLSEVAAGESNEDFLNYLELTDYFVMSAERIPTSKWDTPANVSIITADEIEKNHYQTVAEALTHVNGVMISNYGRADTSGFVTMNGSNRVLVLIDGHRANNSQGMYSGQRGEMSELSMIPSIKIVERIEVVKGGASALYGSDAAGGVVNIITKKGERDETTVDANYGSWHRYNLEATNQGVKGKLSWFVTAGLGKSNEYKHDGTGAVYYNNTDYKDRDISIRVDDQFNDRDSLTVNYMHRSHDFADDVANDYNTELYTFYNSSSIEYKFKGDTSTPGWFRYFNNYQKGSNGGTDYVYGETKLQGVEYQNGWELGDHHKLIAGAEWHHVEAESPINHYDGKTNNIASYVQDTMSLGNKWTLIPGLRYDHDKNYGSNWSPKLAANYRADDKTKFYASWGRVYRTPTIGETDAYWFGYDDDGSQLIQLGGKYNGLASLFRGSLIPSLEPEKGHSETIGVEHDFNDQMTASFSFFNSKLDNAISWTTYENSSEHLKLEYPDNDLIQKRRGVELAFKHNINENWTYDLGYSHTHVENLSSANISSAYGQPNGYRVGVHYTLDKWRANLLGIMASGLDENYFDSKSYAVLNFNTSYDFTERATVYLRALNFTNENYSYSNWNNPAPGRFFQIGATYKF